MLRKSRREIKIISNWKMFCYQFTQDHAKADLIWNEKTKSELKQAIDNELRQLQHELEFLSKDTIISWNHAEFQVFIILRQTYFYLFF